jgi:hypothetical protein
MTVMAAPTAAVFAVLGAAIVLVALQETRCVVETAVKSSELSGSRSGFGFLLLFLLLAAGIIATGTFYYRNYGKQYRAEESAENSQNEFPALPSALGNPAPNAGFPHSHSY